MVTIIDYKVGNLGSILNMLKKIGVKCKIATNLEDIYKAEKIILPGVGAFDTGMKSLKELGFIDALTEKVIQNKTPVLGICLGAQLMCNGSEEGEEKGLGWFDADVKRFLFVKENHCKTPHIGWNYTNLYKKSKLFDNMYNDPKFYFVHSFYMESNVEENILTRTEYGDFFTSSLENKNLLGVQYHPEKSHKFGMRLLENFVKHY